MGEEDAIAALQARIVALEDKQKSDVAYLRDTFDRIDVAVNASKSLEEHVVIPMLLRLAGFGHRVELAEMLAGLLLAIRDDEPHPRRDLEQARATYWKTQVQQKMPHWLGFGAEGFHRDEEASD